MKNEQEVINLACQSLLSSLNRKPLLFDVGAAGGPKGGTFSYLVNNNLIDYIGIEPAKGHCVQLAKDFPQSKFYNIALGDKNEKRTLYQTYSAACSSLFKPNFNVLDRYPVKKAFEVVNETEVEMYKASDLLNKENVEFIDYVKIDTQGFELNVLKGMEEHLDKVTGIDLEAHFKEIYEGQGLFSDIKNFLESKGFILRDIKPGEFQGSCRLKV